MINIQNLNKGYGKEDLFEKVNLAVHKGEKIVLLGQNGSGKTTFIKCLTGEEEYEGTINIEPGITISVMEQEKDIDTSSQNFIQYLKTRKEKIEKILASVNKELENPEIYEDVQRFQEIITRQESLTKQIAQKIEIQKIKKFLKEMNFEEKNFNTPLVKLSGGQKMKLRLAECLSKQASIYVLDEPTNHLDFETVEWVQNKIKEKETVILITHDRYLIKKIAEKIIEIESKKFNIYH